MEERELWKEEALDDLGPIVNQMNIGKIRSMGVGLKVGGPAALQAHLYMKRLETIHETFFVCCHCVICSTTVPVFRLVR